MSAAMKLVLLRHGESVWNRMNLFTGWTDVGLSDTGRQEAAAAGKLLLASGLILNSATPHTSSAPSTPSISLWRPWTGNGSPW